MSEPRYGLDDFNSIPGYDPLEHSNGGPPRDSWLPLNLADMPDEPPEPPTLGGFGIVYQGKRHVFSGPQESAKTLAAYAIGIETLRAIPNRYIAIIDLEMGKRAARTRLRELGATNQEIARILYIEPETPATHDRISLLVAMKPQLVIIDAAAGAYALQGLDDNNRGDVERFTSLYTTAFFQAGIATIVLDHVVKNSETRGKYAIGSERKTGGVDVHLGFDTILPIKRGASGIYKVTTHKDRDGWHERGRLADLHLTSDPETHTIVWEWRQAEHVEDPNAWMPTIYMERVSKYLADDGEACSRKHLEDNVEGATDRIREAAAALVRIGYATETRGPRHSRLYTHVRPFNAAQWEQEQAEKATKQAKGEDDLHSTMSDSGGNGLVEPKQPNLATSPDLASTSPKRSKNDLATSPLPIGEAGESRPDDELDFAWLDELTPDHDPDDDPPATPPTDDIPF